MKSLKITLLLGLFVLTLSGISSDNQKETNIDKDSVELKKSESSNLFAADRKGEKPSNNQA
jgi:hypothetical protein